jgi:hypothetical protein
MASNSSGKIVRWRKLYQEGAILSNISLGFSVLTLFAYLISAYVIPAKAEIQWWGKGGLDSRVKPENDIFKIRFLLLT